MTTLLTHLYSLNNIVSSAFDSTQNYMSMLQHGQSQLRSILQLSWTLQVLKSNRVPWKYWNATELFLPYNLTRMQHIMARKDATYTMLNLERLEKLLLLYLKIHQSSG